MTELLPCPFCGGEAVIRKYCDTCLEEIDFKCAHDISPDAICQSGEQVFWIEHDCPGIDEEGWGVLSTGCYASAREAIEAWNTRSVGTCEPYKQLIRDLIAEMEYREKGCIRCHSTFWRMKAEELGVSA